MSSLPHVRDPIEFQALLDEKRRVGARIGFLPTMGALHEGHLSLAHALRPKVDFLVASIFVNPTQFGPTEDFERYPRDLAGDGAKLASASVDLLFAPEAMLMYPKGEATRIRVGGLTDHLCGPFRPGHFEGVATVVAKFFALVGPSTAAFGRKDFQQLQVLRRMAKDLFFPIEIVGVPIMREPDGIAMSSRNAYLTKEQREQARSLSRGLRDAAIAFENGERDAASLTQLAEHPIRSVTSSIDYVSLVDTESLAPVQRVERTALLAVACHIGTTRLIDNFVLGEDSLASLRPAK